MQVKFWNHLVMIMWNIFLHHEIAMKNYLFNLKADAKLKTWENEFWNESGVE